MIINHSRPLYKYIEIERFISRVDRLFFHLFLRTESLPPYIFEPIMAAALLAPLLNPVTEAFPSFGCADVSLGVMIRSFI